MKKIKEEMFFCLGIFNLFMTVLCITIDLCAMLFFLLLTLLCFINCKKILLKVFCKSIIRRKIVLIKEERELRKEVDLLIRKKNTLELFIANNDKYVNEIIDYDDKVEKLKQINKSMKILESRKENLEDFMKQEEVISRAINDKSGLFDILSNKNEDLKEQNRDLKNEIEMLEKQIKPIKQKVNFAKTISLEYVDNLDGFEFENFTTELLKYLGFNDCTRTQSSGDYGIDVVAVKDGIKYGIQCKNYQQAVGNKAVQEAYSGKNYYNCHVAIVLTNNYFTSSAINQAEKNGVVLWDRDKLKEFIEALT